MPATEESNLRWLITVSSTFQEVEFDGSLLPLFIT